MLVVNSTRAEKKSKLRDLDVYWVSEYLLYYNASCRCEDDLPGEVLFWWFRSRLARRKFLMFHPATTLRTHLALLKSTECRILLQPRNPPRIVQLILSKTDLSTYTARSSSLVTWGKNSKIRSHKESYEDLWRFTGCDTLFSNDRTLEDDRLESWISNLSVHVIC